jgi:hypothetical protein
MPELQISVTSGALSINGHTWTAAPSTEQLCQAVGANNLADSPPILYDGKPGKMYRYFDDLGIGILEIIPELLVQRVTIFMETPPTKRKLLWLSGKGSSGQRLTEKVFGGVLELNGKQLRSPLRFTRFPLKGDLCFVHRIAIGTGLSAGVGVKHGFVEYVGFDFKSVETNQT